MTDTVKELLREHSGIQKGLQVCSYSYGTLAAGWLPLKALHALQGLRSWARAQRVSLSLRSKSCSENCMMESSDTGAAWHTMLCARGDSVNTRFY